MASGQGGTFSNFGQGYTVTFGRLKSGCMSFVDCSRSLLFWGFQKDKYSCSEVFLSSSKSDATFHNRTEEHSGSRVNPIQAGGGTLQVFSLLC